MAQVTRPGVHGKRYHMDINPTRNRRDPVRSSCEHSRIPSAVWISLRKSTEMESMLQAYLSEANAKSGGRLQCRRTHYSSTTLYVPRSTYDASAGPGYWKATVSTDAQSTTASTSHGVQTVRWPRGTALVSPLALASLSSTALRLLY